MAPGPNTWLAFDFGLQRIGVAVGEQQPPSIFPLVTLHAVNAQPDWPAIGELIRTWQPAGLVVGVPLHMDGSRQPITRAARRFAHQLRQRFHLPVFEADERLSSRQAADIHRLQRAAGKRQRKKNHDEDKIAASLILENWFKDQPSP